MKRILVVLALAVGLQAETITIAGMQYDTVTGALTNATASGNATTAQGTLAGSALQPATLAAWVGTTNITTLGTVGTGTWNATVIADGKIASALTGKTYNGLTLTSTTGTLTVPNGVTLNAGSGGTLGSAAYTATSAYEVPLTISTGLTRSTNTVTVNTSQNIATLSNLTSNGFVKTGGGVGTLSVDTTAYAPLASPTFTGTVGLPANQALTTPVIGVATGTSLATTGLITSSGTAGIGYAVGAGGAVTQATNRTTGVTLNKTAGAITLVSAAGSTTFASFTVTNSTVAATDTIIVVQKSGTDLYEIHVTAVGAGSFRLTYRTTAGTTTEQPVFNFAVIKAVAS